MISSRQIKLAPWEKDMLNFLYTCDGIPLETDTPLVVSIITDDGPTYGPSPVKKSGAPPPYSKKINSIARI